MRALLDVNVLIALLDQAHPHHHTALSWLTANIKHGGRLVTFDSGIALSAVKGATARHLVMLV